MKAKLLLSNTLFIIALFFMIGGGAYAIIGYILIATYLVFTALLFNKSVFNAFSKNYVIPFYLFLLFVLLTSGLDINTTIALFTTFLPCLLFQVKKNIIGNNKELVISEKFFLIGIIGIMMFYCYRSLLLLNENPMALRLLISSEKDTSVVVGGGYALPYSLTLLCPFLLYGVRYVKEKIYKVLIYIVIAVGTYFVVRALYTTAILLMAFGYIIVVSSRMSNQRRKLFIVFAFFFFIVLLQFFPLIIDFFSNQEANVVGRRLIELDNMANDKKGGDTDLLSRMSLMLSSLETFLENPILGVGPSVNYNYFEMEKLGVGSHAEWFDIFATYGLFALLLVSYLINSAKRILKNNFSLFLFVLLGFLNPAFFFTIILVVFYIVPMFNLLWQPIKKV